MLPNHFYCEGGAAAGCPTVAVPYTNTVVIMGRYQYVSDKYEMVYR